MICIGIDNGITGAVALTNGLEYDFFLTPTFKSLEYTKKTQFVSRVNFKELTQKITSSKIYNPKDKIIAYIERPMVNPKRFTSTKSALRALEATLITLEYLNIPYKFIDSKEWQSKLLPKGTYKEKLKLVSLEVVRQKFGFALNNNNISDAILIAHYGFLKENLKI